MPEPSPAPEPPVVTPIPGDPAPGLPVADEPAPVEAPRAAGSHRDSIVTIPPDASPLSFPPLLSPGATGVGDRVDDQAGSRSEARSEGPQAAESTGDAPPLPGLPFRGGAPSDLYVSAGGMGSGSSGGFFPWVLVGLVALLAAAAQRRSGLVPLTLAPPRCTAFILLSERPD